MIEEIKNDEVEEVESLADKIVFGLLLAIILPIVFWPITFLLVGYWMNHEFNLENVLEFIFFFFMLAGCALFARATNGGGSDSGEKKETNELTKGE